jgi:ABC-type multidrug transport system permease subunit
VSLQKQKQEQEEKKKRRRMSQTTRFIHTQKMMIYALMGLTLILNLVFAQTPQPSESGNQPHWLNNVSKYARFLVPGIIILFSVVIMVGVLVALFKDVLRR